MFVWPRGDQTVAGTTTSFVWDQSQGLPVVIADGSDLYVYGAAGSPIEKITGSAAVYLHQDQQGSTRLLTDSTGAVVGTYSYDPYGNTVSHTGTVTTTLQYDGQYTDTETGFQYLRARYCDPGTGQFVSVDPAAPLTQARYNYASNDPLNLDDPTGLCVFGRNPDGSCRGHNAVVSVKQNPLDAVKVGLGVVGLGLGVAGAIVAAPAVAAALIGGGIIAGGLAATIGLGQAASSCFTSGLSPSQCGQLLQHANINTLMTGISSLIPDLGSNLVKLLEEFGKYGAGNVIDWLTTPHFGGLRCY